MANQDEAKYRYDIFLSFTGEDTRHTFTGNLYNALIRKGFNTFMDDVGLKTGDQISLSLIKAIEESRISIVVLSENYASSSWCLDELVEILECMKRKKQLVWPIFYKVDPSNVRHQRNTYATAMAAHENKFRNDLEKVHKWRSALIEVANLKGWHLHVKPGRYEYEYIEEIEEMAATKLRCEQLPVGEHVIGHQIHIEKVKSLLDIEYGNTVCMVGIHGTGGMGKTTLAKALYNLIVDQFECAIFLEAVRERSDGYMGLVHLQEAILSKLEGKNIKLLSVDEGITRLKDALGLRRVLLVLDDVDDSDQLKNLAGECKWFGLGSRIIITTRDKHLLIVHQVKKRYEMKKLDDHEALQLFCWNAFTTSQPATNYEDVSNRAVHYANGLPLALKVIGSNLVSKSVEECECALDQYERIPDRKIQDILKISYDCLQDNAKCIFLDIACFFKGAGLEYVETILEKCGLFPAYNIGILVDKSLLTIENNILRMHDLVQDMGKEIVRQDAPSKPGERSRLCFHEDVLRVLTENLGSNSVEGIILDPPEEEEVEWSGTAFEKMNNLRILVIRNARFSSGPNYLPNSLRLLDWKGYPSESLPPGFHPSNIVVLSLPDSHLRLEKPLPTLVHLTRLNFKGCQFLTHMPDVSTVPCLRELTLDKCANLIAVHHSVGFLKKLEFLSAGDCAKLRTFLPKIWLPSLQQLQLSESVIEIFPDIVGMMDKPLKIYLVKTRFKKLPRSVDNLRGLQYLAIEDSNSFSYLPLELFMLPKMASLRLKASLIFRESFRRFRNSLVVAATGQPNLNKPHYSPLQALHLEDAGLTDKGLEVICSCFPNLEELTVPKNNFVSIPASIKELANLRFLDVSGSVNLQEISELPLSIRAVDARRCPSLSSETSRMLWWQALKEAYKLEVVMPKTQIPNWFDHRCKGEVVSFWARRKFPVLALAFIFKEMYPIHDHLFSIRLHINGRCSYSDDSYIIRIAGGHVLLCDLRSQFKSKKPILDAFLVSEWNYVEVKFTFYTIPPPALTISYWGAYVYEQHTNMEDIQFTCPYPLMQTPSIGHAQPKKGVRIKRLRIKGSGRR